MCDVVYALHVQRIEAEYHADRVAVAAHGGELMPLSDRLREFDEWLESEPKQVDPVGAEWRQAMGVA